MADISILVGESFRVQDRIYGAARNTQVDRAVGLQEQFLRIADTPAASIDPIIQAVVPSSARIAGGINAYILGSSFVPGSTITFGGTPATSVVWLSASKMSAVVPAHAAGAVSVVVTGPAGGTGTLATAFTYYTPAASDTTMVTSFGSSTLNCLRNSLSLSLSTSQGSATFQVVDAPPVPFTPLKIGLGSLADGDLIFRGKEQSMVQQRQETVNNQLWNGTAVDSSAEFNRHLAWGPYVNVPADVVALDLIAKFAPDFTGANVASGLAAVTTTFTGDTMDAAFSQLATLVGGYYYRDMAYDVHLFLTESPDQTPDALDSFNTTLCLSPEMKWTADVTMTRNRVIGIGAATQAASGAPPGATSLIVQSTGLFGVSGTVLVAGSQRVTYTGSVGTIPPAPTLVLQTGGSVDAGVHGYAVVFRTATGSSLPGTITQITSVGPGGMGNPIVAAAFAFQPGNIPVEQLWWGATFTNNLGETFLTPGSLMGGTVANINNTQLSAYNITVAIGPAGTTGRKLYRSTGTTSPLSWGLIATLADNTTTAYLDNASSTGTIAPTTDTTHGQTVSMTLSVGPLGTVARDVYRTTAGGSQLKFVGTVADNTTTAYVDTIADIALGVNAPIVDASGLISTLTGIPATGTGSITNYVFQGDSVALYCERNDLTSQGIIKIIEGGKSDGIYEFKIVDTSFTTQTSLNARCDADLLQYASANGIIQVDYYTYDKKSMVGRPLHVNQQWKGGYAKQVLSNTPEAYWRLDEPSGTAGIDLTGHGHSLLYITPILNQPGAIGDDASVVLSFANSGQAQVVTPFTLGTASTFECWHKRDDAVAAPSSGTYRSLFSNITSHHFLIQQWSGSAWIVGIHNSVTFTGFGYSVPNDALWHHYVVVYNSATSQDLYVDGVFILNINAGLDPGAQALDDVGSFRASMIPSGWIDEAAVYAYPLTATQIQQNYASRGLFLTADLIITKVNMTQVDESPNTNPLIQCLASSIRLTFEDIMRRIVVAQ